MKVPFQNLSRLHKPLKRDFVRAFSDLVDESDFIMGAAVGLFEANFASQSGMKHAISLNSGTSAIHLALLAAGVGPGHEVITTPSTFVATTAAIVYTGATPVFVDTDLETWTIDVSKLEERITSRTKAIVPVHLHGHLCDMTEIAEIAKANHLHVVEDACQAHLAKRDGIGPGRLSDAAAFSFYPGKNLGAMGEGGLVVTENDEIADKVKLLRNWGSSVKYQHDVHAFNFRMDTLQAKILDIKLSHLVKWTERRRKASIRYRDQLSGLGLGVPKNYTNSHVFHVFAIRSAKRDYLRERLIAKGIETSCHYPVPVHLQKAYAYLGYRAGDFPNSELLARQWLSLPMDPMITESEVDYVCEAIEDVSRKVSLAI